MNISARDGSSHPGLLVSGGGTGTYGEVFIHPPRQMDLTLNVLGPTSPAPSGGLHCCKATLASEQAHSPDPLAVFHTLNQIFLVQTPMKTTKTQCIVKMYGP